MLHIPGVLTPEQVGAFQRQLAAAGWSDGRITAGHQSAQAKHNLQLPQDHPVALELSAAVRAALARSSLFFAAALPRRIFSPLFNCYRQGDQFGNHIDNAVRYDPAVQVPGEGAVPVRTDLSATLFLSTPGDYDGGELVIDDAFERREVKLPAGDLFLYPATYVHRVHPVTRGIRLASFFWIQSLVRSAEDRRLLLDLDRAIQKLHGQPQAQEAAVELTGTYHNLLRRWTTL